MEERNYTVYRHIAPNGKMYVGITRQKPECRWKNGLGYARQSLFFNAIKKYGWDNFEHEVLLEGLTESEASLAEKIFISYWNLTNSDCGYNLEDGGVQGYVMSDVIKGKHSKALKGKRGGKNNPMYGRHITEEGKRRISQANSGRIVSDETRRKMSQNRPKKKVLQLDKLTKTIIGRFESTHDAGRKTGVGQQGICNCCNHKAQTAGGYIRRYYDEYIEEERRNAV